MDIMTVPLPLLLPAVALSVWGAVKVYRAITRTVLSRARRIIIGTLLGSAVPTIAGFVSYWVDAAIGLFGGLLHTLLQQF